MTNFEIQLFTHYPTLTKIWKASDGAYFVKLKDVQAYSNTLPDNTFIEILRPDNLPPLPDDVLPLNVNWVEFPFLWQFRGDFQISGADFDLETPGDNNKMWVYRIVADIPSRQKSITQNGVVMTVVAGDYIMSDGSKWSKIFDNKRVADLESNKVDKVTGKGLSSNDFTSAYKSALDGLSTVLEGKANVNNPVFTGSVMLFGSQTNDGTFAQFAGAVKVKSTLTVDGVLRLNENLGMANGRYIYFKNTAGLDLKVLGVSGENIYIGDTDNSFNGSTVYGSKNSHIFYVNGVEKARINGNGDFVLGIDSPNSKLHIVGGTAMTGGWNRVLNIDAQFPMAVFSSNSTKYAGIGYDYTSGLCFQVNAATVDVIGSGIRVMTIANNGNVLIGTVIDAGYKLDVNGTGRFTGAITATQYNVSAMNTAPASATATGTAGEIRWTNGYVYLCVATNSWKRAALATW